MVTTTPADILQRARFVADAETASPTNDFTPDSELTTYLTNSYRKLLDWIVDNGGHDLVVKNTNLTAPSYTLPADFYRASAMDVFVSSTEWRTLRRFNFQERNRRVYQSDSSYPDWRIIGTTLYFEPPTSQPATVRLWYIGDIVPADLTSTVATFGGWDEFLILDIAMQILTKEDRDLQPLLLRYSEVKQRIVNAVARLCVTDAEHVAKTEVFPAECEDIGFWIRDV